MDAIVVDFFHWTMQGEFKFEPRDWPDPDAMVKELKEMGIEVEFYESKGTAHEWLTWRRCFKEFIPHLFK